MSDEAVDQETGEIVPVKQDSQTFDMAQVSNPGQAIEVAETLVSTMAEKCSGPQYVANIAGKQYPKVEWWTTVGAALGLFPREEHNRRLDRDNEVAYEAAVAVYKGDQLVTRASAVCSSAENRWSTADEYAVRSMAATRATGKAYRLGLSFLAVMSGLEATPAEEMPADGGFNDAGPFSLEDTLAFGKHKGETWADVLDTDPGYVEWAVREMEKLSDEGREVLRGALGDEDDTDPAPDVPEDDLPERVQELLDRAAELSLVNVERSANIERAIKNGDTDILRVAHDFLETQIEKAKLEGAPEPQEEQGSLF